MPSQSIAGCAVRVFLGDTEVGFGVAAGGNEMQMLQRIDALGDIHSKEPPIPTRRAPSMTLSTVRIRKGSIKALGGMARGNTVEILSFPALTLVVYDQVTDEAIETLTGAVCEQRSWNVDAAGIFSENVSFQGVKMKDEDEE